MMPEGRATQPKLPPVPSRTAVSRQDHTPAVDSAMPRAPPRPAVGSPGKKKKPPPPLAPAILAASHRRRGTPPRESLRTPSYTSSLDQRFETTPPAAAPHAQPVDTNFDVHFVEPLGMTLGMKLVEVQERNKAQPDLAVQSISTAAQAQHPELRTGLVLSAVEGQSTAEMTSAQVKTMLQERRPVTITFTDKTVASTEASPLGARSSDLNRELKREGAAEWRDSPGEHVGSSKRPTSAPTTRKQLPPVPSRGEVDSLRAELARSLGQDGSAIGVTQDRAATASETSVGEQPSAAALGARGRRSAEVETGTFQRTGNMWSKAGQLTKQAKQTAQSEEATKSAALGLDAHRQGLMNRAGSNLTGVVRHRQKRWDDAAKLYASKVIADVDRFGDAAFLAAMRERPDGRVRQGAANLLNIIEAKTGLDLDGDGDIGMRGEGEVEADIRNSRSVRQFDLGGLDDHVLNVVYDKESGQYRYRCLVKAFMLAQAGQQLMASGEQFWGEAEFRFMCCIAEFCEEAGYDMEYPQSTDSRDITRQMDRKLYFGPSGGRGNHDYGLLNVGRLAFEVEEVYAAYASLAYIRFVRASHCLKRMTRLGSTTCEEDVPESVKEEWRKVDVQCRDHLQAASRFLSAWLSFIEELESWLGRHQDSLRGVSKEDRAVAKARGEKLVESARQMPDKAIILLGSKLLLMVLFPGYQRSLAAHEKHAPPSIQHISGGHWFPEKQREGILQRARSTTDFKREQAHGHCLCSICLATRLYDLGKDWLDLSQHTTNAGQCWTVKRLLRATAEQEEHHTRAVLIERIVSEYSAIVTPFLTDRGSTKQPIAAKKQVATEQELAMRKELYQIASPWRGEETIQQLRDRAEQAGVNMEAVEVAVEETRLHAEMADLNHHLADLTPDLLCVTTVGGWKGFQNGSSAKKLFTLGVIIWPLILYYADVINDIFVIKYLLDEKEFLMAIMSGLIILMSVVFGCLIDKTATEHNQKDIEPENDSRMYAELLPLVSPPLWQRCVMNVTFTRMLYENYWAYRAWQAGRIPRAAYDQVRSVEGLFESTPQAILQAYLVLRAYYRGNLDNISPNVLIGLFLSFANTAGTLAMMGQHAQLKWRACFFLFCWLQMVLRVMSLCGAFLLVSEYCGQQDVEVTSDLEEGPPEFCSDETPFHQYWFFCLYLFISMMGCVVLHVIHMQGHSGGSIFACLKHAHPEGTNVCQMILDLTILNSANTYAYVLGILNIIVPVDSSPFSILKNADPRPPRLGFFAFRMVEIAGMCLWFEINLRPDLDYKFDYDAAFWILFVHCYWCIRFVAKLDKTLVCWKRG